MNLTAGRCHNVHTQAFRDWHSYRRSIETNNLRDGSIIVLPGLGSLHRELPETHPLALRPALGYTIRYIGRLGDAEQHRDIRKQCYAQTGFWGQVRYSVVNLMLQWFYAEHWPEREPKFDWVHPYIEPFRRFYQWVIWLPSLLGMLVALARVRREPVWSVIAFQQLSSMVVAAVFFGDIRLRTPYDMFSFMLAGYFVLAVVGWARRRRGAERGTDVVAG